MLLTLGLSQHPGLMHVHSSKLDAKRASDEFVNSGGQDFPMLISLPILLTARVPPKEGLPKEAAKLEKQWKLGQELTRKQGTG